MKPTRRPRTETLKGSRIPALFLSIALAASACTTSKLPKTLPTAKASSSPASTITGPSYYIVNANITYSGASASVTGSVSLSFDASKSTAQISENCSIPSGSGTSPTPCACVFSWEEINQTTGTSIPVKRSIQTQVTQVQPYSVTCAAPNTQVYKNEILDGTTIRITLAPATGNSNSFTSNTYNYVKTSSVQTGSFQDAQGHFFDNVLRYTCYEQFKRGMSLKSKMLPLSNQSTGKEVKTPMGSQFCVKKASSSSGGSTTGCESLADAENSAQAYYYNLYVRDSERGSINAGNSRYVCPRVEEFLPGGSQTAANAWPLDTTFSLSLDRTSDFSVGVEAFTKVSIGSDPNSQSSGCFVSADDGAAAPAATADNASLIKSCLGFAAAVNKDGSCPTFKDKNQLTRQTFRLRRFIVLYPPTFDTNGVPMKQAQATDTIYVLDRPVKSPTNSDPNAKPYTMRGPKPCPFAFFDHKGVIGFPATRPGEYTNNVLPVYAATNNTAWAGTNVDGIEFPNQDSATSCSATMPIFNADRTIMSLTTINAANPVYKHVYVRPIQPWAPHYVEDTDFMACAPKPEADSRGFDFRDPPLHFAKDPTTGIVGWCAEVYPTQNNNIPQLDQRLNATSNFYGSVPPFTSHVVKNSTSQPCTATVPSTTPAVPKYPDVSTDPSGALACPGVNDPLVMQAVARHPWDFIVDTEKKADGTTTPLCAPQTCDRTAVNPSGGTVTWPQFPLLATARWTEAAITADSTYGCTMTYDAGGGKTGKSSPSEGCCGGNVRLTTGYSLAAGNIHLNLGAHLEPDVPCLSPKY